MADTWDKVAVDNIQLHKEDSRTVERVGNEEEGNQRVVHMVVHIRSPIVIISISQSSELSRSENNERILSVIRKYFVTFVDEMDQR